MNPGLQVEFPSNAEALICPTAVWGSSEDFLKTSPRIPDWLHLNYCSPQASAVIVAAFSKKKLVEALPPSAEVVQANIPYRNRWPYPSESNIEIYAAFLAPDSPEYRQARGAVEALSEQPDSASAAHELQDLLTTWRAAQLTKELSTGSKLPELAAHRPMGAMAATSARRSVMEPAPASAGGGAEDDPKSNIEHSGKVKPKPPFDWSKRAQPVPVGPTARGVVLIHVDQ